MDDIYNVIAKHLANESSPDEEKLVEEFKADNPIEFLMLSKLWKSKNINIKEYDVKAAWKKIIDSKHKISNKTQSAKIVPLRTRIMKYAAIAASIIVLIMVVNNKISSPDSTMMVMENINGNNDQLVLSDGSTLWLNEGAIIEYPKKFNKEERKIKLIGEAFFDITKNPSKPFIINTHQGTVTVLGTSFNVKSTTNQTTVSVKTGKVKVATLDNKRSVLIVKNESAVLMGNNVKAEDKQKVNYLSWKTGEFTFNEIPIALVIAQLNTYYDDVFVLDNVNIDCPLTASFEKNKKEDIAKILSISCGLKSKVSNGKYRLY